MGYLYENSGDERFQHLCQSLLVTDFPQFQCFPIGQPDGGRDGWDADSNTVLQVKFRRTDEDESAQWLIAALRAELPKIARLATQGATRYILATNARGTAHPGVGRIDLVQDWLDENVPIPAVVFWRDEIDRRFDTSPISLKLKYSEMLSLEDGLEVVIKSLLDDTGKRSSEVLRAFVATQFDADKTVKFRQVHLSNDLLDLFVDIPVHVPDGSLDFRGRASSAGAAQRRLLASVSGGPHFVTTEDELVYNGELVYITHTQSGDTRRGAAELFLSSEAQEHLKLVVLEGAPGQGKSTLAQFVCQVQRAKYLNKKALLERVSDSSRNTPFRIPIKIDLRDYAAFLDGHSPFMSAAAPVDPLTLEVFLAQLISYQAGGLAFSALDSLKLMTSAPVLLFFDGLDEVADVEARAGLVTSIGESLARWGEFDADIQVVVTSRPSIFGRPPSFGRFGFVTLNLQNIDAGRINEYTTKWVAARGLGAAESAEVKKILAEKLELAHIRDLTRNPMQLTILLSLIHQIGHSLPDQRTDLYDRYVDLFLTREADKSPAVRRHRPILLGFIQHLAWLLQTQSESSNSAGSISAVALEKEARDYLSAAGQSTEIAVDLFGGGLERIFVLVERIEGLYEFEVQPLREFFCAQHLYSTAPVGTYREQALRGDRAQRFEALAANPFWLNVCRFYAGSCERGETGTLVMSLEEMVQTGSVEVANHARRVALALLRDWVFSNAKYAQMKLISTVFDSRGLLVLLGGERRGADELRLDVECGQDAFRDQVFEQLQDCGETSSALDLCLVLRMNGGRRLGDRFLKIVRAGKGVQRTSQLSRMLRSGAAGDLASDQIWQVITEDAPSQRVLLARCSEVLSAEPILARRTPELVDAFVKGVLDGLVAGDGAFTSDLSAFAELLASPSGTYVIFHRPRFDGRDGNGSSDLDPADCTPPRCGNSLGRLAMFACYRTMESSACPPTPSP